MGGQSTYQRSTLTANHGTYFLDTSVSYKTQWTGEAFTTTRPCDDPNVKPSDDCFPRSVNVFVKGQCTYDMFFLFAKPVTKQTYQIYVGPGFRPRHRSQGYPAGARHDADAEDRPRSPWPTKWTKNYNDTVACANFKRRNDRAAASCRSRSISRTRTPRPISNISIRKASASPPASAR